MGRKKYGVKNTDSIDNTLSKKYKPPYPVSSTDDDLARYLDHLTNKKKSSGKGTSKKNSDHDKHPKQERIKFKDLPPEQQEAMKQEFIAVEQHLFRLCQHSKEFGPPVLQQVEPLEYYRDMFPEGSFETCEWIPLVDETGGAVLDKKGEPVFRTEKSIEQRPNGMISVIMPDDETPKRRSYTRIIFDDLAEIKNNFDTDADKILVSPVAFSGRKRRSALAYSIYGITIDLDNVGIDQVNDLIYEMQNDVLPMATYLIHTASGLHVSYLFEEPIPAYPQYFESLNRLKADLSNMIWNQHTSRDEKKQFQGIFQGFRMVGTATKMGQDYRSSAWKLGDKVTLRFLNDFVAEENKCDFNDLKYVSVDKAKELWPDWFYRHFVDGRAFGDYSFKKRIELLQRALTEPEPTDDDVIEVQKDKTQAEMRKEIEKCERELARRRRWYETWIEKMKRNAYDGNRHYCVGVMFHYAMKAEIDIEEAVEDALSLVPYLNSLTMKKDNQFTDDDVYCAMVYYERKFIRMGRNGIKRLTNIDIGETKRNGRNQKQHLKMARFARDLNYENKDSNWYDGGGRPVGSKPTNVKKTLGRPVGKGTKQKIVQEWRQQNPDGSKIDCERETGLSRHTVLKWWDS